MKDYEVLTNEEAFKKWLPKNGVNVLWYPPNIKRIQKYLKMQVDVLLKDGIDKAIRKIEDAKIDEKTGFTSQYVKNFITALKKYDRFMKEK